jgi:hypothetical protein
MGFNGFTPGGRLTTVSGDPVPTDASARTNIYYSPYLHDKVRLYDGTRWKQYTFSTVSLAIGTLTANLPYDVFLYDNSGTLTLELSAWTNDTTRATDVIRQDGVRVKSGATTRLYLGCFRTTSTTEFEDTSTKRFLWNEYNRVPRVLNRQDTTNSWTYNTATYRQANASTSNQVEVLTGDSNLLISIDLYAAAAQSGGNRVYMAIGESSTTTPDALCSPGSTIATAAQHVNSTLKKLKSLGYHYYTWLERGNGATSTFIGDNGDTTLFNCGLSGWVMC